MLGFWVLFILQVSELVSQYKREHLTVWGNASYEVVSKCFKEVRMGPAKLLVCLLLCGDKNVQKSTL